MFEEFGLQGKGLAVALGDFSGEIQKLLMSIGRGFCYFLGSFDQIRKPGTDVVCSLPAVLCLLPTVRGSLSSVCYIRQGRGECFSADYYLYPAVAF